MDASEILDLDVTDLASAVRSRAASPVEVVDASLARIAEANDALNACCVVLADDARATARAAERASEPTGPLHGVPVVVKDAIWMRDVPTTMGSRALADFV